MGSVKAATEASGSFKKVPRRQQKHQDGQTEGFHDPRAQEEAAHPPQEEGRTGDQARAGAQGRGQLRVIGERCGSKKDLESASLEISRKSVRSISIGGTAWRERCSSCRGRSFSGTFRSTSSPSASPT